MRIKNLNNLKLKLILLPIVVDTIFLEGNSGIEILYKQFHLNFFIYLVKKITNLQIKNLPIHINTHTVLSGPMPRVNFIAIVKIMPATIQECENMPVRYA